MKVVTRFPPSPTGFFHIGSARTALFNYLFAARHGGKMYLRFEDTDQARSKREFENDILEGLKWLGITYELPDVFRQSERTHVYQKHIKGLMDTGMAYEAEESTDGSGKKVIRFKNPNVTMTFTDLIRGDITFDTKDLGDFVIARSIKEPLYHVSVVIDDYAMGVTHVIRGEDHISNTPRQILILEALGFPRPFYAHIPLILAPDKSKLSKRHGAVSINQYKAGGYLPEALVNYLALLGWNPGTEQELFTIEELVKTFSFEHVHKSGAIFNTEKLQWFNREYLNRLPEATFKEEASKLLKAALLARGLVYDGHIVEKLLPTLKERIHLWQDVPRLLEAGEFDYFFYDPQPSAGEIPYKGSTGEVAAGHLQYIIELLQNVPDEQFETAEHIKALLWDYASEKGRGEVLWPFRFALSGRAKSPDPFVIASIIGKQTTLRRVQTAIKLLAMS